MEDTGVLYSVVGLPLQDEEEFDDDYESPYSADEGESAEDYESPNDDMANDYEPPPSQPSEELKVAPCLPIGDSDYIGNPNLLHASIYANPDIICTCSKTGLCISICIAILKMLFQ